MKLQHPPNVKNPSELDSWCRKVTQFIKRLEQNFFRESEYVSESEGSGDSAKPVKLDSRGKISESQIEQTDIDHTQITGNDQDVHTQYYNSSRLEEWLGEKTTDDITEGTDNLYFTDERAQDAVGSILQTAPDAGQIAFVYDDATPQVAASIKNGVTGSLVAVTNVRDNAGSIEVKTVTLTISNGGITQIGSETDWQSTPLS